MARKNIDIGPFRKTPTGQRTNLNVQNRFLVAVPTNRQLFRCGQGNSNKVELSEGLCPIAEFKTAHPIAVEIFHQWSQMLDLQTG